jgi:hypothetical protein
MRFPDVGGATAGAFGVVVRRHVLFGGAAFACMPGSDAAAPAKRTLAFLVSRNGSEIGTHRLSFVRGGDTLTVRIDADFRVGFGPITLYRYHHTGIERWQNGAFASLDTQTDDNGTRYEVHARRTGAGVAISATDLPDQVAPPGTMPLTHWAVGALGARLFNPQTGKLLRESVQPRGTGMVTLANGARIPATGFTLAGEAPIEDWYDSARLWAALDGVGKDGSRITYRRL